MLTNNVDLVGDRVPDGVACGCPRQEEEDAEHLHDLEEEEEDE